MLSPSSLAAFTAGVMQPGFGKGGPMQRVRTVGAQPPQSASPAPPAAVPPPGRGDATSGRPLPRGSLLDLSV